MAKKPAINSLAPPYRSKVLDATGFFSFDWVQFIRTVFSALNPLGTEKYFQIENKNVAQEIDEMQFDGTKVSYILVEYFAQRFHSGGTSLIEGGTLRLSYNAKSNTWTLNELPGSGPNDAAISFSIDSDGQVFVTPTVKSGTLQISKLSWRARTFSAQVVVPQGGWAA
jgi:hypothetical protein